MLVFIDESGDPGFKISKGSSPVFVTSMVIFDDREQAIVTQDRINRLREKLRVGSEFKFNACCDDYRDAFFEGIAGCRFRTRAVVVQKELIYSENLRYEKETFYNFFVRMMMKHDGGALVHAKVVIDGSGDRVFRRELKTYIHRHIPREAVAEIDLKESHRDPLVQLADMTAGAIARSYRSDRPHPSRWRTMLQRHGQIEDVWNFK